MAQQDYITQSVNTQGSNPPI